MRLYGVPEAMVGGGLSVRRPAKRGRYTVGVLQYGIPVARMELLDDVQTTPASTYSSWKGLRDKTTLFFEFHGSEAGVEGAG